MQIFLCVHNTLFPWNNAIKKCFKSKKTADQNAYRKGNFGSLRTWKSWKRGMREFFIDKKYVPLLF